MQNNQNTNSKRHLKVYGRVIQSGSKFKTVPEIRLMGQWLKQIGYVPGQTVSISQQGNSLTINVVPHV